jgi:hypothetical protein
MLVYNTAFLNEPTGLANPVERDECLQLVVEMYTKDHALRARVLEAGRIPIDVHAEAGIPTGVAYKLDPKTDFPDLLRVFGKYGIRIEPQYVGTPKGAAHEKELQKLYNLVKSEIKRASAGS